MKSPSSSRLLKRIITWTSVLVVMVIVFIGLLRLGLQFSSEILFELVKRETNDYYQLSFEEIDIDVWDRSIQLKKVLLKPDSTQNFQGMGLNNLYDFELTGLHIDLKSITSIYTERKLVIENVRIIDPQIHIIRKNSVPNESFSLQTGNLYKEISDYLKVLRIDFFTIENATFQHSPSELALGNIDFSLGNFLIDSASRPNQKFYSESIELEIRDQTFELSDSIHQLSFDRLLLSTSDSVLTFENLVLEPLSEEQAIFHESDDKIVYNIKIPHLKLKGVDYFSAYRNNSLNMEELALTDSEIFFEEQTHAKDELDEEKGNSLLKQLIKVFDNVRIGKMRFINSHLDLKTNEDHNHNYQHVQSERADIVLYNFFLDSSNYHIDYGKKYFDDFDIIIKDYSSYLPDSIHTVNFDLLQLSSFDSSLIFQNFKISNISMENNSDLDLTLDLPLLRIKGMDYLDVLINKNLLIKELYLHNPTLVFDNKSSKSSQRVFPPDNVYAMLEKYFKVVGIKEIRLNQGMFVINEKIDFSQTDLKISNFKLNPKIHSWFDALDEINLELRNLVIKEKSMRLQSRQLSLDDLASQLTLNGVRFSYWDRYKFLTGGLSNVAITGFDLDSISLGNYLTFDSVKLTRPHIKIETLEPNMSKPKDITIGDKFVQVIDGKLEGVMHDGTSFSLNQINTQMTVGALNDVHFGQARDIQITLPNSSNQIKVSKLSLTTWSDIYAKDIEIKSLSDNRKQKVQLNGSIPAIALHGFKQKLMWQGSKLMGDSVDINSPDIHVNLNDLASKPTQSQSLEIQFQKINLHNGAVSLSDNRKSEIEQVMIPQLSLSLKGFHFPQKEMISAEHLIHSDDLTLNIENIEPTLSNGDDLFIQHLSFNKSTSLLSVDNFNYKSLDGSKTVQLPNLKVEGLDILAYVDENRLKIESIRLKGTTLSMDLPTTKSKQSNSKRNFPKSIDIKYFLTTRTEIDVCDSLKSAVYAVHDGKFEVRGFKNDGKIIWNDLLAHTEYTALSGKDFSILLDDGYTLSIDRYASEYPDNTLSLDHISLKSKYTPKTYSSQLTAQKDWFDVDVEGIQFSGLDYNSLLSDREYRIEKVSLKGLNGLVYRDKNVPFKAVYNKKLPQTMLKKMAPKVYIDTLQVLGDLTYQEKPHKKEVIGEISFNELDAYLFNITSVDANSNGPMRLYAKGRLVDAANFEVNVKFEMNDPQDQFTFTGQIVDMPLRSLNKMLRPAANINIKDGYAEQIDFDFTANNNVSRGEMKLRYRDLKIQILDPETSSLKHSNQGFKTFFANTFVVNAKNPSFISLKPGVIFQKRDSSRAIFQYWAKSLLSGAVSSIGIHKSEKAEKQYGKDLKEN